MYVHLMAADVHEDTWRGTGRRRLRHQSLSPSNKHGHKEADDRNKDAHSCLHFLFNVLQQWLPQGKWPNGARDKVHPEFRQGQCFFCPCRKEGAERSGVATAGSDVSFIEQIGGARTQTPPSSERAVIFGSPVPSFQNGAAWRLNVISRPDKRSEPPWLPSS